MRWQGSNKRTRFGAFFTILNAWYRRERERRYLSAMRRRDFGDLAVPPGLILDEVRRWPWQEASPQWDGVAAPRSARCMPLNSRQDSDDLRR